MAGVGATPVNETESNSVYVAGLPAEATWDQLGKEGGEGGGEGGMGEDMHESHRIDKLPSFPSLPPSLPYNLFVLLSSCRCASSTSYCCLPSAIRPSIHGYHQTFLFLPPSLHSSPSFFF